MDFIMKLVIHAYLSLDKRKLRWLLTVVTFKIIYDLTPFNIIQKC